MTPALAHHLREIGVLPVPQPRPEPITVTVWKPTHPGDEPPF